MAFQVDTAALMLVPAVPVPWERLRAEARAVWSGPPVCSKGHAYIMLKVIEGIEGLNLADLGEPRRTIVSTDELTVGLVSRFAASLPPGWSGHTTKGRLSCLRSLCSLAEQNRWTSVSPFRLRSMGRLVRVGAPTGKRHLGAEEIRRLFVLMRTDVEAKQGWAQWRARRLYALTSLIAYTGVRRNEGLCLWVADVELDRGIINLVPHGPRLPVAGELAPRFKTEGSAAAIALPAALKPILADWSTHRHDHPQGFPLPAADRVPWMFPGSKRISAWTGGPAAISPVGRLKALGERAGIGLVTWQMLRRSWCTRAEALGVPQALITRQARHSDTATTLRYYQQRDLDALRLAVDGFIW